MSSFDEQNSECPAGLYLKGQPEQLAVDAYRHWLLGLLDNDETQFSLVWINHRNALGEGLSRLAMEGLHTMVAQLDACANCPMRFMKPKSRHLCRDEFLILGLISGIHNGQDRVSWKCASHLTCPALASQLIGAAGQYAAPLKAGGKSLMPFPQSMMSELDQEAIVDRGAASLH
ncbi:MAG: hypothetical protein AAFR39_01980 [Pseudomonadota bacterium]